MSHFMYLRGTQKTLCHLPRHVFSSGKNTEKAPRAVLSSSEGTLPSVRASRGSSVPGGLPQGTSHQVLFTAVASERQLHSISSTATALRRALCQVLYTLGASKGALELTSAPNWVVSFFIILLSNRQTGTATSLADESMRGNTRLFVSLSVG